MSTSDPRPPESSDALSGTLPGVTSLAERQRRRHVRRFLGAIPLNLVLSTIGFLVCLPFLWMLLTSVKPLDQIGEDNWLPTLSANTDRGQFSEADVDRVRDEIRGAIRDDASPAAAYLAGYVDLDAKSLTTQQLADQLNGAIQAGEPLPESVTAGVELPPRALRYKAELETRDLDPLEARKATALYNAWALHAALPGVVPAPATIRWHNYAEVFRQVPFARYYVNSIFVAAWITFLQVFTSALSAFAFARLQWPGRDKVFLLYLSTMMLPGLVMMIPNYQIMISLGLVDTIQGLILPGAFTAFGTFLLRQFMLSIPASLDEAAEIDGASKFRTFFDVILPLARPGLVTLAIFTFIGSYNSFFWPLVMLKSEHRYTLPIGLLYFDSSAGQETNLLMAAVVMSVVPMILVFVVLQKQLVAGIQLGAVKG
ncbi:MAG: carbohydrate ABC transporter permease [Planctomycetota bacterium]